MQASVWENDEVGGGEAQVTDGMIGLLLVCRMRDRHTSISYHAEGRIGKSV
jgi:hypothetical protein